MLHRGGAGGAVGFGHVAIGCGRFADEPGGSVLNVRIQPVPAIKKAAGGKLLCTTAGGIRGEIVKDTFKAGPDILIVGRGNTASKDIEHAANEFTAF